MGIPQSTLSQTAGSVRSRPSSVTRPKFAGCSPITPAAACERAQAWVQRLQHQGRPRALLQANRLLVECLSAAGRTDEAKQTLAGIAAQCAEHGMVRYLLDGGSRVVALLAELRDDLHSGRWNQSWSPIPAAFLDTMVSQAQSIASSAGARPAGPP